jgi:YidC/Oxa1 family membrane protein insertase
MYPYFYNYGVVIIIFSIILKVLFYPLTAKSYSAAKDMQKLQPLMAELKVKYKNDPQTLNKETMKLYKEQKINPLGGCLPMLPQMPIFFALFKVFDNSIEFRQAGFVWWLDDLSRKDPTFVLPLVMGATMFIQQKMSTNVMDEKQKIMLYTMPIIFTFIFMSLSSGLILYYTVFNILSIVQQYLINRAEKTAKAAVPAAPAVRK